MVRPVPLEDRPTLNSSQRSEAPGEIFAHTMLLRIRWKTLLAGTPPTWTEVARPTCPGRQHQPCRITPGFSS